MNALRQRFRDLTRRRQPLADAPLPLRRRKRFSLAGSIGFERHIAADQERIADQVLALLPPDHFRALLLCGAYGRGEGVRLRAANGKEIAERYDYGVVVAGTDPGLRAAMEASLRRVADSLSATTGVPLHFRLFREEYLHQRSLSFAQADLRWSGRLLRGDPGAVECMTARPFEHLDPGELLWQLVEHGLGLLHNQEQLRTTSHLSEHARLAFFAHLIRAVLMCGDLRLAVVGQYHPAHAEKLARLEALDQRHHRKFMALYQVAHRAYATLDSDAFLEGHPLDWQARVVWLWQDALRRLEAWRRGRAPNSWEAYCRPYPGKGQGAVHSVIGQLRANLAGFGVRPVMRHPLWALRHPRERLISAMPLLLSGPQTTPEPVVAAALALPPGTRWPDAVKHCVQHCVRYQD
ncbi:hypothetical protein [Rhabdochromatium marinum]|uniref:hypothetical protein n=1 Tax=Rhabdochromatium marinum TaxID=48729 RepID=UPI00190457B1|nr:hypothetical protein [Rhabdochromatium marinum]MBK1649964.1 hypothetical protein [Rhabdochromatium marinum]